MTIPTTTNGVGQGVSSIDFANRTDEEFICYVDGKQVDDWAIAHAETNRILGEVASNMEQAMSGIRRLHIPVLEENKN